MPSAIAWYDREAALLAPRYEAIDPARLHAWLVDLLPAPGSLALDIGAGTGRDARWLSSQGLRVWAVEPSAGMRKEALSRPSGETVHWISDSLPELTEVYRLGVRADLILLSAVWMHLPAQDRAHAFARLIGLLAPGGLLALTLRSGPSPAQSAMHPVSDIEICDLSAACGATVIRQRATPDAQGRPDVRWVAVAIRCATTDPPADAPCPAAPAPSADADAMPPV